MKKRFTNIDEVHAYVERQAKRIIKHYYTDWKNYDRPALMRATGEKATIYVILRECGSYLFTAADLERENPKIIMDYYAGDSTAKYYKLDLRTYTAETIPAGLPKEYRKEANAA